MLSQQRLTPNLNDLFQALLQSPSEDILASYVPHPYRYWTGSGREALRQILVSVGSAGKKKVGVPAYTCHVVLDAVKQAGCKPVFYDSGVVAMVEDIQTIIKEVDVLLLGYNFGFLPDMDAILELCRKHNVILVEDCAQALGATWKGKMAGSFGDHAFYSFGISKNIGFCGGMISSKRPLALQERPRYPLRRVWKAFAEAVLSSFFFNPLLYSFTRKILRQELLKEQDDLSYAISSYARKVVLHQFQRYEGILERRRTNAGMLLNAGMLVQGSSSISSSSSSSLSPSVSSPSSVSSLLLPLSGNDPSWLYAVFLADGASAFQEELFSKGIELGRMQTFRCFDDAFPKAKKAEEQVLTFALYRPEQEVRRLVKAIQEVGADG